jgi:uncharacterized damage-inducible protein DinB
MSEIRGWIERYEAHARTPRQAVAGLSGAELAAFPVPGTWSVQQIVVHLLESDLAATHRMRRIAAEETPLIIAYDETAMASKLRYHEADVALVCDLFELNRRFTASWLRTVPEADFARAGVHNQSGKVTLARMVEGYVNHVEHHMQFVREKRRLLGKPLA